MKIEIFDRPTYLLLVQSAVYLRNGAKNDRDPDGSKTEIVAETLTNRLMNPRPAQPE